MNLSSTLSPSIIQKILFASGAIILIVTYLQMVFFGKNLTFTTKFTPSESEQNSLRNQSFITQAQVLIIFLCIVYVLLLPLTAFSSVKHPKKEFMTVLMTTVGVSIFLILLNIYFLAGASAYRGFMGQKYDENTASGVCSSNKSTLCVIGTCTRMQVFHSARGMAIAFSVINNVFSVVFILASIMVNKKRKDSQKMELIV